VSEYGEPVGRGRPPYLIKASLVDFGKETLCRYNQNQLSYSLEKVATTLNKLIKNGAASAAIQKELNKAIHHIERAADLAKEGTSITDTLNRSRYV